MHAFGPSGPQIDMPKITFEFPSTPLTGSDIDVVPPTPPLEDAESGADSSVRIQEDYDFPAVAEVVDGEDVTGTSFLKPRTFSENGVDQTLERVEYPACGPRRKALLIGIKYDGVNAPVEGAHNDVEDMKNFLMDHHEWLEDDITILKDDGQSLAQPTRDNIIFEMRLLVQGAQPGDRFFFHFSGHGGQITDTDGDEADGLDEVIFSCDKHPIVDDELHDILVKPLPAGCRLTALFDCCSSGTGLDLPVVESSSPVVSSSLGSSEGDSMLSSATGDGSMLDLPHQYGRPSEASEKSPAPEPAPGPVSDIAGRVAPSKHSSGDVIMWSSCRDSEKSYEVVASVDLRTKGAMTHAFIESLKDRKRQSYRELLDALNETLVLWGCPQRPTMSSAQYVNMKDMVSL